MHATPVPSYGATVLSDPSAHLAERITLGFLAQYKTATRDAYTFDLRVWARFLAEHDVDPLDITRTHVELWIRHEEARGLAAATISRRVSTVCSWYRFAYQEEFIDRDPTARVKRPKLNKGGVPRDWLDHYDVAELLRAAADDQPGAVSLFAVMAMNALRVSEACGLNVGSFTTSHGMTTVSFIGKGDKPATLALAPIAAHAVQEHQGDRDPAEPMWVNQWGRRVTRRNVHDLLDRCVARSRISRRKHVTPHTLRRSYVTDNLENGANLRDVQYGARHDSSATTLLYDQARTQLQRDPTFSMNQRVAAALAR